MAKGGFALPLPPAPVAVFAMLLAGCGDAGSAAPAAPPSVTVAASPSGAVGREAPTSSEASAQRDTSGPSFGVDRVPWPATARGAYALMGTLPKTLGGESLAVSYQPGHEESGAEATAEYGDVATLGVADEYTTSDTESGDPELLSAGALLAARFGLVFACAEGSYRGTIVPLDGGYGPGFDPSRTSSEPRWFSCEIDGAEGDEGFTGHAVGWTSTKAAWLVIAEDAESARTLIAGLDGPGK